MIVSFCILLSQASSAKVFITFFFFKEAMAGLLPDLSSHWFFTECYNFKGGWSNAKCFQDIS